MTVWQPNKEGIFHDLPAETYHSAPGLSHSMCKNIEPTPAHLQSYLKEKREPSAAMILGSLIHSRILEPSKPLPKIAVKPADMKFNTKDGKAWRSEREGSLILSESEHDSLLGCVDSVAAHPVCCKIFERGESEVSIFKNGIGELGALLRKARLDFIPCGNTLVDVKTTTDASAESFSKDIFNLRYYSQAAWYLDIFNDSNPAEVKECFLFVAVEKRPPYLVAVYNLDQSAIAKGRERNFNNARTYLECVQSGEWPGYSKEVLNIDLPKWANRNLQNI